jgi:hypothetical protein
MANADKRQVSTDALQTLGTIIGPEEKRDAIHLAVLPAVAGARLYKGEPIGIVDGKAMPDKAGIGIVDPFLTEAVQEGEYFWMVLKPRIITSLRHVWSHPDLPAPEDNVHEGQSKTEAVRLAFERIGAIASDCDITAMELIAGANKFLDSGEYLNEGGRWEGTYLPDEFWPNFEIVTGRKVEEKNRESFFSCSC